MPRKVWTVTIVGATPADRRVLRTYLKLSVAATGDLIIEFASERAAEAALELCRLLNIEAACRQ